MGAVPGSHLQCVGLPLGGAAARQIPGWGLLHMLLPAQRPCRAAGVPLKHPCGAWL